MAAPKGNHYASSPYKQQVSLLKGLAFDYAFEKMQNGTEEEKKFIFSIIGKNLLPKPVEVSGEDGEPIKFELVNKDGTIFIHSASRTEESSGEQS